MTQKAQKPSPKSRLRILGYTLISVIIILVGFTGFVLYRQARRLTTPQRNQTMLNSK